MTQIQATNRVEDLASGITGTFHQMLQEVILDNSQADSPLFHAEGLRYLTRMFANAAVRLESHDRAYPRIMTMASLWLSWGFANPDAGYSYSNIHGDYEYRLWGRRGTARIFDVETWEGDMHRITDMHHCSGGRDINYSTSATPDRPSEGDIELGPNGEFEIILSRTEHPGNWIEIAEGPGTLMLREFFSDWENEQRGEVFIERIGAQYPPPPTTADDLAERLQVAAEFLENVRMLAKGVEAQHYALAPNTARFQPLHAGESERGQQDQLALRDVHFIQSRYACGPDEAVIVEADGLPSDYWNYYLMSHNWENQDFNWRPTSINAHQAVVDADGKFRAVIAHRDPGVPNWLDAADRPTGLLMGRYFKPDSLIVPTLTVVPLDRLRDALPADTPAVTPEERSETLRRRMHSVRARRCEL